MNIKHYDIKSNDGLAWYGYKRIGCPEGISKQIRNETMLANLQGMYSERECEVDCFLSVLQDINKPKMTLLDLGTGWGEWSLALSGVLTHKLIPVGVKEYFALAVECDKKFGNYALDNFVDNHVNGTVVYGAVGKYNGKTKVNVGAISDRCCGSSLSFGGYFSGSRLLGTLSGLYHTIHRKTDNVQMYSLDYLAESYLEGKVDLVIMDVQGTEVLALEGCQRSSVEYWMIGTHSRIIHHKVVRMLSDKYEMLVDAKPNAITFVNDTYRVICQKGQDGIILCKRK